MALYSLVPRPSLGYDEAWPGQIESYAEFESRLHSAIRDGDVESLRSMIQLNPELRSTEPDLLHWACRCGHLEVVKVLIEELRWNPQCKTDSGDKKSWLLFYRKIKKGDTPLHVACRYGHTEIVRYFKHYSKAIPNATTGELPLHIACCNKDPELVKLVSDCDVNAKIKCEVRDDVFSLARGDTPLHVACRQSNLETVRYLCKEKHCDTNIQNAAGELPLHIACGRSQSDGQTLDIVKLVSDCNVNTQEWKDKDTPLHIACRQSNLEVVRHLCEEKRCDTNIKMLQVNFHYTLLVVVYCQMDKLLTL